LKEGVIKENMHSPRLLNVNVSGSQSSRIMPLQGVNASVQNRGSTANQTIRHRNGLNAITLNGGSKIL
jgi:hypothetical protein